MNIRNGPMEFAVRRIHNYCSRCVLRWTMPIATFLHLGFSQPAQFAYADVLLECASLSGNQLTGAQSFDVECLLSTDEVQDFFVTVLDFACSLSPSLGATGTITAQLLTGDPDGDGPRGPGSGGEIYLFGPGGLAPVNPTNCTIAGIIGTGICVTVPMGETRYIATITYEVSPCAKGDFNDLLEGYSVPPSPADTTELYNCSNMQIPFAYLAPMFTVVTGSCCTGFACLEGDINEFCCQQNYPGARWFEGRSCDDPVPCPCLLASDCDDGVACTEDACNQTTGLCENVPNADFCSDGVFCNGAEACEASSGCQPAAAPSCDDGVACTVDACDAALDQCTNGPVDGLCDDGLFCNGVETCDESLGCVPGFNPCEGPDADGTSLECDEAADACVVPPIPTVSTWGLVTLALVILAMAKLRRPSLTEWSSR